MVQVSNLAGSPDQTLTLDVWGVTCGLLQKVPISITTASAEVVELPTLSNQSGYANH